MAGASTPSLPLQDRVAIITGASRGIGRAIALHLATLGARLVVNYTSNSSLAQEVIDQINSSQSQTQQPRAIMVRADVSDPAQVQYLFDEAERAFSVQAHILVATAGVLDAKYPAITDTALEDFDRTYNVNVRGTFLCCQVAAKRLMQGGGGRIVTFSSSLAATFQPGYGAYTASKAAVEALTKILAKELRGTRITANCVAPGPIATDLFFAGKSEEQVKAVASAPPLGRLGEPKDVAPLVTFLVGDEGEWINGQVIRVNGGVV